MKLVAVLFVLASCLMAQTPAKFGEWVGPVDGLEFRAMAFSDLPINRYVAAPPCDCTHISIRETGDSTAYRVTLIYRDDSGLSVAKRTVARILAYPAVTESVFAISPAAVRSIKVEAVKETGKVSAEY